MIGLEHLRYGAHLVGGDTRTDAAVWCDDMLCGNYLLGISDGRPRLIQWRGILAACIMFRCDDHLQDQAENSY
jgi:hypothetical protein